MEGEVLVAVVSVALALISAGVAVYRTRASRPEFQTAKLAAEEWAACERRLKEVRDDYRGMEARYDAEIRELKTRIDEIEAGDGGT